MADAILQITDGTTIVDLLSPHTGFHLESWNPNVAFYKGGGTFQNSPIATGRQLVDKQFENETDVFNLKANELSPDAIITDLQNIRRLLEQASDYWDADWANSPVWIKAQAKDETNPRYALIHTGRIPEDENPYSQPFLQPDCEAVMDNLTLVIEHALWTDTEPQTTTAVKLSAVESYDGRNLGNVDSTGTRQPTSSDEVYVSIKRNEANLTDVYIDDGGVFSANLMDAALPFNLLPAIPAVNDAIYFGIDTSLSNSGPFASLVFDIGTAQTDITNVAWEYWDGAVWAALTDRDNTSTTDAFDTVGVNSVHWEQESDWATTAVNGVTGYWVRARVTAIGAAPTAPTQQNRDIYSVVWPYTEIQSTEILGDISALSLISLTNPSDEPPATWQNRMIVGLRSLSRGSNFTAYINWADEQNPTGMTISTLTAASAFANDVTSPTGRIIQYTPAGVDAYRVRADAEISSALAEEYYGEYRAFLRASQTGGSLGDIEIGLRVALTATSIYASERFVFETFNDWQIIDLGKFKFERLNNYITDNLFIRILIGSAAAGITVNLYDLILIPVDEWAIDTSDTLNEISSRLSGEDVLNPDTNTTRLRIDSITDPKKGSLSVLFLENPDRRLGEWLLTSNGQSILQSNVAQRLWFFSTRYPTPTGAITEQRSRIETANKVQVSKQQRYLSMRGNR